ncbi:recombination protein RecR [Candidatus Uhrbacteria bacterium CG10_big_fil_rev_8_21_14_0_10_48_11]|uniref:Recombination protein RecR n=1 Tax=Candidatus Uhrbacteria bacterium CG10_big_fil_rev_8_21_14_0_10_48_11 TaxID=1975037 RepID=A0A2M8LFL1_9BACT|nr:MAG: recombination protein RecR [Candidatus Uhrbacteria bacterium CG10_big_fil_rev_8_21_14_0_10_48_11]
MRYPAPVQRLVDAFLVLPGIGRRTAVRFAYSLVYGSKEDAIKLAKAIEELHPNLTRCQLCFSYSEKNPCAICVNSSREQDLLCVVADDRTISAIEQTGSYKGRYFVLGGVLNPVDGVSPAELELTALHRRMQEATIQEVFLAFDADTNGEATVSYLTQELRKYNAKITKPARGLPAGSRLEYADEVTLGAAILERRNGKNNDLS